jgi:hypothetical protein
VNGTSTSPLQLLFAEFARFIFDVKIIINGGLAEVAKTIGEVNYG